MPKRIFVIGATDRDTSFIDSALEPFIKLGERDLIHKYVSNVDDVHNPSLVIANADTVPNADLIKMLYLQRKSVDTIVYSSNLVNEDFFAKPKYNENASPERIDKLKELESLDNVYFMSKERLGVEIYSVIRYIDDINRKCL